MHILIVTDQHPDSLGGVQVAIRLQRRYLEGLGHRVTVVAPALHRPGYVEATADAGSYISLRSRPITRDREYAMSWPSRRSDRQLDLALEAREHDGADPIDLVHIQGDFWGAMIGLRAARRRQLPVIITMHNNVDEGTRAVTPLAPVVFAALRVWRRIAVGPSRRSVARSARGAWRYLAELAADADDVTAPSAHFAHALEEHGVAAQVDVTRNGVDDELVASVREMPRASRSRPRLVWLGRMSHEKRVLEFVDAIAQSGIDADVTLHGAGLLLDRVTKRVRELGLSDRVHIAGPVPHDEALAAMRQADALVQTSIGFETQGLTPFEAAALGTPTIFCDANIADDLGASPSWTAADGSVEALAAALRDAVAEISASPGVLRVDGAVGARLLQSAQSTEMVARYERLLAAQ